VSDATRWLCRGEHALTPSQIPAGWDERGPIVDRDVKPDNVCKRCRRADCSHDGLPELT
jgi:hypothetical protein